MTAKAHRAVGAELKECRGYADKHVTRLVCRMIDRAVRAERCRWKLIESIRAKALEGADVALVEAAIKGFSVHKPRPLT